MTVLQALRRANGMTQDQLQEKSGVQKSQISRIENGKGGAGRKTLEALAGVFGCAWFQLIEVGE